MTEKQYRTCYVFMKSKINELKLILRESKSPTNIRKANKELTRFINSYKKLKEDYPEYRI